MPQGADFGPGNLWAQGDAISHAVAIALLIMSLTSWYLILRKGLRLIRQRNRGSAVDAFWLAPQLATGLEALTRSAPGSSFDELAHHADLAIRHFDTRGAQTLGGSLERGEFLTRALRQSMARSTASLESGLTTLASIGSTAPFVGLFGTVWGIYHALVGISASGAATLDHVAGPVGEALIMTAAGLFVAIPAVLAYNAFNRANRVELAELDAFAHDLHAFFTTGARLASSGKTRAASVESRKTS